VNDVLAYFSLCNVHMACWLISACVMFIWHVGLFQPVQCSYGMLAYFSQCCLNYKAMKHSNQKCVTMSKYTNNQTDSVSFQTQRMFTSRQLFKSGELGPV
jgi:hypothetical protein